MSEWESVLTSALDGIRYGIVLLDKDFEARFINRAYYRLWALPPPPPGTTYNVTDLIEHARRTGAYDTGGAEMDDYARGRLALIRDGTRPATELRLSNGRILNFESQILPAGGRMLTFDDVTDLVQTADRLRVFATVDDLTKLMNRRQFLVSLKSEFSRAQRDGCPLSVLMIDADDFKQINDRHGHSAGDDVLRAIAGRCLAVSRKGDIVGRLGGEEFAMVLSDTDMLEALKTAERLCRGVADEPFTIDGDTLHMTVSIGVAARCAQDSDPSDLLRFADRALYSAKANGRNCVVADARHQLGGRQKS
jgi:diguanylate cyclase (GGDEF)-like protein